MRNLKKVLALALVFAMAFTFTAGAAFTDINSIGTNYVDDVNMLVELGVLAGYPDGSFGPAKNITRAEFAKMAYTLKYGSDADGDLFAAQASKFTDVEGNANVAWAKGYINYCANQNIVSGVGNNKFNPQGNITVAEAAKMILVILGCDPSREGFTGANWMSNVVSKAIDLGVFNGWAGDPSQLATRELVAKLMRNAVFAPIYTYSAITGAGGQVNALGTAFNKTLGETTMGLYHESGIVVANEHNFVETDEKGDALLDQPGSGIAATGDDEMSIIYYTTTLNGVESGNYLEIDRGLSDELLGNKVDVYFTADIQRDATTGYITAYHDAEVIGNVLVSSDTVVYNVAASEVELLPNHKSESEALVRPYISFADEDGNEVKISTPSTVNKYMKKEVAKSKGDVAQFFNKFAYLSSTTATTEGTYGKVAVDSSTAFVADLGSNNLAQYRFVSVDGGKTYSYIFKTNAVATSIAYVTAYNEAKGTIALSGIGNKDFEEVTIKGDVAIDDMVACYYADDKLVVEKAEAFKAAFENYGEENNTVILNGKEYTPWVLCDLDGKSSLFDYYDEYKSAMTASTKYYIYKGMIMRIEQGDEAENTGSTSGDSKYAVILRSSYDSLADTAYVFLTFEDGKTGRYEIGKLYKESNSSSKPNDDLKSDFDKNRYFGAVVKCKILDDGTVDLSAQNFKSNEFIENYGDGSSDYGTYVNGTFTKDGTKTYDFGIDGGKVKLSKTISKTSTGTTTTDVNTYYTKNDDTTIFLIYGNPMYDQYGVEDREHDDYIEVAARPYKISELADLNAAYIDNFYYQSYVGPAKFEGILAGHVVFEKTTKKEKNITAASMTVGRSVPKAQFNVTDNLAYVVSATQSYNPATGYYAKFNLINEKGSFAMETAPGPVDSFNAGQLTDQKVGPIDQVNGIFPAGSFIRYKLNEDGKIKVVDNSGMKFDITGIKKGYTPGSSGMYLVNITGEKNGVVTFYKNIYESATPINPATEPIESLKFHKEHGCKIITIADNEYVGDFIVNFSPNETTFKAKTGNAIIQVEEGQIIRIFSFADGYTHKR